MKKIVLLITIQILCMHSFVVNAQRIFSTSYTMDDGLAANRVYSILQDSCGFMWFGTDDGLSRFDGIAFKNYYLSEYINATTSNSVKKIFIDRRGRMWIGLDTGIVIYDSKTDTFQPFHAKTETGEMIQTYVTDMSLSEYSRRNEQHFAKHHHDITTGQQTKHLDRYLFRRFMLFQ